MRADNPATRKPTSFRERFFHAPDSATWEGDSYRGIHTAKRRGYRRIDVNTLRTLDGVSAAFHWMRPLRHGYVDPKGLLRGDATVDQLTWAALSRLRPRRAPSYRVRTVQQMFTLAAALNVGIELELKNSRWTLEEALALKAAADKLGVWVIAKTLSTNGNARHNLAVFHRAGFVTVVLPRGLRRIPRSWWPVVDHVRGPVIWTGPTTAPPVKPAPAKPQRDTDRITALARTQVGYHEGRDANGNWNNDQKYSRQVPGLAWSNWQPWCATFICWLFWKTLGVKVFGTVLPYQPTASCDVAMNSFKQAGRFSEYPAIGAQVFFGVPGNAEHTGFVTGFDVATISTVEGNTNSTGSYQGDGVYAKTHQRRDPRVLGYGYPRYGVPLVSADPAWGRRK